MTVRRAVPDEWQLLRDVRLMSLADSPEAFGSTYEREAAFEESIWRDRAGNNGWFIAVDGDVVLGTASGFHDDELPPGRRDLVAMWVAPAVRGTGVAAELVGAVVQWARDDGATEVALGVADGNERARALYLKCGFVSTGERVPLHSGSTRQMEIYRRPL